MERNTYLNRAKRVSKINTPITNKPKVIINEEVTTQSAPSVAVQMTEEERNKKREQRKVQKAARKKNR